MISRLHRKELKLVEIIDFPIEKPSDEVMTNLGSHRNCTRYQAFELSWRLTVLRLMNSYFYLPPTFKRRFPMPMCDV
jgi:hypothetical protein